MTPNSPLEGLEVPLHQSLTEPMLFAGLPRTFALVYWTTSGAFLLGLQQIWIAPLALLGHILFAAATRYDPFFTQIVITAIKTPRRLDP